MKLTKKHIKDNTVIINGIVRRYKFTNEGKTYKAHLKLDEIDVLVNGYFSEVIKTSKINNKNDFVNFLYEHLNDR